MNYTTQLHDSRWKAKREQILARDKHTCTVCGMQEKLQVHHIQYTGMAWEAPDANLITLCSDCHKAVHHKDENYGDFALVYKDYLWHLRVHAPEALPTLVTLMHLNDMKNVVRASHEFLAAQGGTSVPTVARHMKRLRELGMVLNDVMVPYACYRIHPLLAWKGKAVERDAYIAGLGTDHPFMQLIKLIQTESKPDEEEPSA